MAKAMLAAKAKNEAQVAAVERSLGWERLRTLVSETEAAVADTHSDSLGEVVERYASVRRMSPAFSALSLSDRGKTRSLLAALDVGGTFMRAARRNSRLIRRRVFCGRHGESSSRPRKRRRRARQ